MYTPARVIDDMPFWEYLDLDLASSHRLRKILTHSPKHARMPSPPCSKSMTLGTLAHALILEPEVDKIIVRPDAQLNTNAGKLEYLTWLENATGQTSDAGAGLPDGKRFSARIGELTELLVDTDLVVCSEKDYATAGTMRESVLSDPTARLLLSEGKAETTILAQDPESGVTCKIRPDWLYGGAPSIVDLKTAQCAAEEKFSRDSATYGYPEQAWLYKHIHRVATGEDPAFYHLVVENVPPYDCVVYEMDEIGLYAGEGRVRRALDIWAECLETGIWPGAGYDFDKGEYRIRSLSLPRWYVNSN